MSDSGSTLVRCGLVAAFFLLAACASDSTPRQDADKPLVGEDDVNSIVTQPMHDLNVMQDEIPAVLIKAGQAPYAAPADCAAINGEVASLDQVLGPDLDALVPGKDSALITTRTASNAVIGAARDAASGWIPLRGLVRTVTGAERHSQAMRDAVLAGAVRRAYLKGYGEKLGCSWPASPSRAVGPAIGK